MDDINIPDNNQVLNEQAKKKKCYGNRRDQRFREKYRARGMKPALIEKLLNKQKKLNNKNKEKTGSTTHATNENRVSLTTSTVQSLNKRKRDISLQEVKFNLTILKSASSRSIAQILPKKKKKKIINRIAQKDNANIIHRNYRFVFLSIFFSYSKMILIIDDQCI